MRILAAAATGLAGLALCTLAWASPADEAFEKLAAAYLRDLPEFSPVAATAAGDHRYDHRLDQADAASRARRIELYRDYLSALEDIPSRNLSRANQVDAELLRSELESNLWSLEVLEEWAWNPLVYVDIAGSSLYSLLARDFAPLEQRLEDAAARLEQVPRFLAQVRGALEPLRVPQVHAQTAVAQNQGIASIIDTLIVPRLGELPPEPRKRLEAAIAMARDALAEHQAWLQDELVPAAEGDFRLGARLFDQKLRYTLDSPLGRREIRRRAEREYADVREEMFRISKAIYRGLHPYATFPDDPEEAFKQVIIRAALQQAYEHLPARDGIVDVARQYLAQATEFVQANDIVTLPGDPIEIIVMPEYQRGVAVAYLE
ncbi:MAG TPA: DUF885 family protein, partial [Woeseiaceae bacterium]|nr:DUF885 family protein [Woeseiaceae bacterium]